jgi:O-antigen ligase
LSNLIQTNSTKLALIIGAFILTFFVGVWIALIGFTLPILLIGAGFLIFIGLRAPFIVLLIMAFLVPIEPFITVEGATLNRYISIILLVVWVLDHLRSKKPIKLQHPIMVITAWLLFSLLTSLFQPIASSLVDTVLGYVLSLELFIIVADYVNTRQRLYWILSALLAGMFVFLGIWIATGGYNRVGYYIPTIGTGEASGYGNTLGVITACILALILYSKRNLRPLFFAILLLLILLILQSGLRRNIYTSALVLVALVALPKRLSIKQLGVTAIIMLGLYLAWTFFLPRLSPAIQNRFTINSIIETGGSGRLDIFKIAIEAWKTSPIIGVGIGNFRTFSANYIALAPVAHNMFLQVLAENGLVGIVLLIWGWLATVFTSLKAYHLSDGYPDQLLSALPFAMSVFMVSGSLINPYGNWRLLWLTFGLALASAQVIVPQKASETG